jgi:SAM-dependent methyltransferase
VTIKLQCPSCRSQSLKPNELGNKILCHRCKSEFGCINGIICFFPDNLHTRLDDIDYDEHYSVSNKSSYRVFADLKAVLGERLKASYDVLVEIRAGTGGFTKGMLTNIQVSEAIITDISSKMLSQCKRRVFDDKHLADNITFATYSSAENIFPSDNVDCIVGYFVLHHILNYKDFLKSSFNILRKGGSFIFSEPGYQFHHALVLSMPEVLEALIDEGDLNSENDLIRLGNWIRELNFNLKYVGDPDVLSDREDKHLFLREDVKQGAFDAGFELVEIIPYGSRVIRASLESYLPQLDLSPLFLDKVFNIFEYRHKKYFDRLAHEDAVPAYVFYFKKKNSLMSRIFKSA